MKWLRKLLGETSIPPLDLGFPTMLEPEPAVEKERIVLRRPLRMDLEGITELENKVFVADWENWESWTGSAGVGCMVYNRDAVTRLKGCEFYGWGRRQPRPPEGDSLGRFWRLAGFRQSGGGLMMENCRFVDLPNEGVLCEGPGYGYELDQLRVERCRIGIRFWGSYGQNPGVQEGVRLSRIIGRDSLGQYGANPYNSRSLRQPPAQDEWLGMNLIVGSGVVDGRIDRAYLTGEVKPTHWKLQAWERAVVSNVVCGMGSFQGTSEVAPECHSSAFVPGGNDYIRYASDETSRLPLTLFQVSDPGPKVIRGCLFVNGPDVGSAIQCSTGSSVDVRGCVFAGGFDTPIRASSSSTYNADFERVNVFH